jgi:hypothetical protein
MSLEDAYKQLKHGLEFLRSNASLKDEAQRLKKIIDKWLDGDYEGMNIKDLVTLTMTISILSSLCWYEATVEQDIKKR